MPFEAFRFPDQCAPGLCPGSAYSSFAAQGSQSTIEKLLSMCKMRAKKRVLTRKSRRSRVVYHMVPTTIPGMMFACAERQVEQHPKADTAPTGKIVWTQHRHHTAATVAGDEGAVREVKLSYNASKGQDKHSTPRRHYWI